MVLVALALAGCGDDNRPRVPSATVPTAAPTTTTTQPYAVPPVIDAEYVDRVIAKLDAIVGDATRLVVQTKTTPREVFDRLRSVYASDEDVDSRLNAYARQLSLGLPSTRTDPGDRVSTVRELISSVANCIYVRVDRDYSAVAMNGATSRSEWIALRPLDKARDPWGYNITGWAYVFEGFTSDGTQPDRDPCLT